LGSTPCAELKASPPSPVSLQSRPVLAGRIAWPQPDHSHGGGRYYPFSVSASAAQDGHRHFRQQCKAKTIQLANHYKAAQEILDGLGGDDAPRLILNDHCPLCEFREQCRAQAIKTDDLSLLGHMTAKKIDHYAQTGTLTVTQLSYTYHARRHKLVHPKGNPRSLPLHALAIRQKRILVIGKPTFRRRCCESSSTRRAISTASSSTSSAC